MPGMPGMPGNFGRLPAVQQRSVLTKALRKGQSALSFWGAPFMVSSIFPIFREVDYYLNDKKSINEY